MTDDVKQLKLSLLTRPSLVDSNSSNSLQETNSNKCKQLTLIDPLLIHRALNNSGLATHTPLPTECEFFSLPSLNDESFDYSVTDHTVADINDITLSDDLNQPIIMYEMLQDFEGKNIFSQPVPVINGKYQPMLSNTPTPTATPSKALPSTIISQATPSRPIVDSSKSFELSYADLGLNLELPRQPKPSKRRLAFDKVTKMPASKNKKAPFKMRSKPQSLPLQKMNTAKGHLSTPLTLMGCNKKLYELWSRNLYHIKVNEDGNNFDSNQPEESTLLRSDLEVMRKGSGGMSYEDTYDSNIITGHLSHSSSVQLPNDGLTSANQSTEIDFIMSTVQRRLALQTGTNACPLSPILDEDDEMDYDGDDASFLNVVTNEASIVISNDLCIRNALEQQDQVSLNGLMLKKTRLEAAAMFSSVLALAQNGMIVVRQQNPYSDILLGKKN
jgi:hypothetical protein